MYFSAMELRHHPLMSNNGVANWPPRWMPREPGKPQLHGEYGVLTEVATACNPQPHNERPSEIFLFMEHESIGYVSSLLFDDASFCGAIGKLLRAHCGKSIEEIGRVDLSHLM
jgi:hypothetical protein